MRIKTNAAPELELTAENKLLVKGNGDKAYRIANDTFNLLTAAYENVAAKNGDKAVIKLGEGKSASTFLFAYDEDSKQNVLFIDGYLVTKIKLEKDEISFWTTKKSSYKSFKAKDMIANKMKERENAVEAEKNLKAAKEEVINYFNVKKVEEPILMQARLEVKTREDKIAAIKEEIKNLKAEREEKEQELQPLLKDKKTTQNSKEVKNLNKEIDALKAKENAKEEEIIAINAQLDKAQNDKLAKKLEANIKEYKETLKTLEETKKDNNRKIVDANANLDVVQTRSSDRVDGKSVSANSNLKTGYEYEKEIAKLEKENAKIDEKISQLNAKIKEAQKQADKNLGYKEQLAKVEKEYDKNLATVAPKSALAKTRIDEIEKANYDEAAAKPENVKKDTPVEMVGRIENAKYQAATESFEKEINAAAAEVSAKADALRNDTIGNLYVRAQEIIDQPKYDQLYNYINGLTPVLWGTNVTLKGKPGYGCLVVGPQLYEEEKINGISKDTVNRTGYIVVGKTIDEVRKSLPETAEDFLNIEGASVYAIKHVHSNKKYTKAYVLVHKDTALLEDENGNAILDSNKRKQFVASKNKSITFDIRTEKEIAEFNKKEAEKAKKNGKKVEERVVDFITPDILKDIKPKLAKHWERPEPDIWKEDYANAKAKKWIIVGAVALGAAVLATGVTYHFVNDNDKNNAIEELKDDAKGFDTAEAFEDGKKQVGNNAIAFTYDVDSNVVMTKTNSEDLTKDITPYENRNNAKGWTECGAIYQYVYNTTKNLGKDGNILMMDGASLYDEYFGDLELTTYDVGNWSLSGAPKDANGNVIADLQLTSAKEGYEAAAKDLEKTNPETAGTSAIDPQNEELNGEAQKRINKDTKGTNKAMVVDGVYVDFVNDTAFAVSEDGKNIVKLTYEDDIKTLDDTISGMNDATTDWYTCAAANQYLPGVKYQNFYISDKTNVDGEVYSKNIIEVEKDEANYLFTEFEGYKVLNTVENKMPSKNEVAYVSLVGTAAHNVEDLMVYGDKGEAKTYTATTPEAAEASKVGQIFNYEK